MSTLKIKRFTKPHFLKQIGREYLGQFFNRFSAELNEKQITLPAATLGDDEYHAAVARLALAAEGLPVPLVEVVHAIESMATVDGEDRLERATDENGLAFEFHKDATMAEKAMLAWLTNAELFMLIAGELRLARLASFDYYGARRTGHQAPADRSDSFAAPNQEALALMTADMEEAFRKKNRGERTCHIEVHLVEEEYWFLIRHGDTYARVPTVKRDGQMETLHFRPTKDDVAVYTPQRDGIRLHAGTKWEKDLYRETIGRRLLGELPTERANGGNNLT